MKNFLAMILMTAILFTGCGAESYERSEKLMGTVLTLKAEGKNSQAAVDESFKQIGELAKTIFADVKKIENAAEVDYVEVSPDVYKILETAQKYSELTDGAFDITVGAAIKLWGIGSENAHVPTDAELDAVKNLVGYKHLHLRGGKVYLDKRGMKITLGGVAKGYGVDIARKIFAEKGIENGLIDFGTSTIFAIGKKKIGIKNPDDPNNLSEVVELENSAISTSGDYEKFFVANGRRYHHIIDPKTCAPTDNGISSISVIVAGDVENCAMIADILSTSFFVMGSSEKILKFDNQSLKQINSGQNAYR